MYIKRDIEEQIKKRLFQGKVIVVYGPRQAGKTTLIQHLISTLTDKKVKFVFGDDPATRNILTDISIGDLKTFVIGYNLLIIDEAQYITNIGVTLKLLHDHFPEIQVIATGSSSFELANKVVEPLTGRNFEFFVLPFSVREIISDKDRYSIEQSLSERIIYGSYPEIVLAQNDIQLRLQKIASDYTSRDILKFDRIRRTDKLIALLSAFALQIGQEVSYLEIGQTLGIDRETITRYVNILEQSFIIFRLEPYAKNPRRSLRRGRKIYFWDTGIRNALINNFNPLDLRTDTGHLFENYIIAEFLKTNYSSVGSDRYYFWRAYNGEEIDLLVEHNTEIKGYECKFNYKNETINMSVDAPVSKVEVITSQNFTKFM